jgi:nucleotide-binding universal stress UspA family protein
LRIVIGYNGSISSRRALVKTLEEWSDVPDLDLRVCFVDSFILSFPEALLAHELVIVPYIQSVKDEVHSLLGFAEARWEFVVLRGDPVRTLEQFALTAKANFIAVGRGAGLLHRLGVCSTSWRLWHRGRVPVVVVP